MAVERIEQFTLDLSSLVNLNLTEFSKIQNAIMTKDEADFARKVSDEGLSYDDQLSYYQSKLSQQQDKTYPNQSYISSIKNQISNLKNLSRYQKYRDTYTTDYTAYKQGKLSLDNFINYVQQAISQETNINNRNSMSDTLLQLQQQKVSDGNQMLNNQIALAENDKSVDSLNSIVASIQSKRMEAMTSGNADLVSNYDVMIQSANQQINSINAENKMNAMDFQILQQGSSSVQKLDMLNNVANSANKTAPVFINGVKYNSESDYWNIQKNNYLSGSGSGFFSNFLTEFSNEQKNQISVLAANSNNGAVPFSNLQSIVSNVNGVLNRADIQPYAAMANAIKTDILDTVAHVNSAAILDEYTRIEDYQMAVNNLNNLQSLTGINQSSNITGLVQKAGTENIKQAQDIAAGYSGGKISPETAVSTSPENLAKIVSGEGAILKTKPIVPPIQTTPQTVQEQATTVQTNLTDLQKQQTALKQYGLTNTNQLIKDSSGNYVPQKTTVAVSTPTPPLAPTPTPSQPVNTSPVLTKSHKVASGDTASKIAAQYKITVAELQKANPQYAQFVKNPNYIQAGWSLNLPS